MKLLVATSNRGKFSEICSAFQELALELVSLSALSNVEPVIEGAEGYTENAILKAVGYAKQAGMAALADDSGLEVKALGGAPGVLSARLGGEMASDRERTSLLLNQLHGVPDHERDAVFVCAIAVVDKDLQILNIAVGRCHGRIGQEARGEGGFGYDPIFIPEGHERTFGELPIAIKNQISHRARALASTRRFLISYLGPKSSL